MEFLIPILHSNEELGFKDNLDLDKLGEKLIEEAKEVQSAINCFLECDDVGFKSKNIGDIVEEAMDAIQIGIGILNFCMKEDGQITKERMKAHLPKLLKRGWLVENVLRVEEF
ncbi:MAG: hypothetical protein N4A57_02615 [Anaeromicrobium sp.]|uniref:hypothetical protein n=1 Tax=Anaeromicrobium sp. TaxID=1929132 RepID=UPI0025E5CDDB|nr:hypothetical protein [Anaeromicrobium sp.]MCT4593153.1 hypothetical protein [Anaeromicrobium sp.]